MTFQNSSNSPTESLLQEDNQNSELADRRTTTRVRIRIPKEYHEDPVISRLVSEHGVVVNINAALLGANARDDGWFDLELRGTSRQIQSALIYLEEMDLEIWGRSHPEEDGW